MAKKTGKYEANVVKTYYQVSGKPKKGGKKVFSTILIVLVAVCFVATAALGAYLYFFSGVTPGLILNNVSVLGVSIGGMSREDASATLESAFEGDYCQNNMVITMYDQQIEIPAHTAGITLDVNAAVEAAYDLGRTGNQAQRKLEQSQAALIGIKANAAPFLSYNDSALREECSTLFSRFTTEAIDGSWEITGGKPDLSADEAPENTQTLVVTAGTPGYEMDMEDLLEQIKEAYANAKFSVEYTCKITEPKKVDLNQVYDECCTEPVEAQMDKDTFEVSEHSYGYVFDLEAAQALQKDTAFGERFEVPFTVVAPQHTKAALEEVLFRDVLGTYTAYSASDPNNRDVNLKLSCKAINDTVLMPGEIFSYNPALGKRTPEAGWKEADGYVGKETVKEYGGGICQASSCLYLSAMLADLEIVERVNHGFISAYMPYGMDATVSWGGPEFRFKNTTEYPLRIEAWSSGGAVTVRLVGTDTKDYYVKVTYEVLSTDPFETVYEEMTEDNEKGYKDGDVVTSGYTGYKVRTYRCKYSKDTDELLSREVEATSVYNRRDKIICKIPTEETTEPSTTEPTEDATEESTESTTETPTESPTEETTNPGIGGTVTEDG